MKENKKNDKVDIMFYAAVVFVAGVVVAFFVYNIIMFPKEWNNFFKSENEVLETTVSHIASIKYDKEISGSYANYYGRI